MKRIVIIGGVAAGPKIAAKLLRTDCDCQIDLYTDENLISYSACGLPYFIEGLIEDPNRLIVRRPEQFEEQGAHIHLNKRCIKIIPDEHKIIILDINTKNIQEVEYDKLAICTGARPIVPSIKNIDLKNIFTVRTIDDGIKIREKMRQSKKAVIVGGGYIGIEMLEALYLNGLEVNMIEMNQHILPIFDPEISDLIEKEILRISQGKVKIITNDAVVSFMGEEQVEKVVTAKGQIIDADLVIVAVGVTPNTEIAKEAGIELGVSNAIRVNNRMQTSAVDIYAAGDCIENFHLVSRNYAWIPLGSSANKEGRCAAINIAGGYDAFPGVLGSAVTRYDGFTMSLTGLTETEAKKYGFDVISSTMTKKDKAGYMPEAENITIKLVVDRRMRKILGAQAIGSGDADKRINTVASAIQAGQTVDEFLHLDMTYAPPYSTAVDPLLSAALVINNQIYKA
ncbi:MAG: FAD-dependent oxidoreductase [Clostridium sp.]|nr:FAD-dependent oxidoreductase [Clostridium sp.]